MAALTVALLQLVPPAHAGPSPSVERALRNASARYGVSYAEMRAVSYCESKWNRMPYGAGSYGLFQFIPSTWRSTPYGHYSVFDPWWNALAAAWVVRRDGGWRQWTCKPW